MNDKSRYSVELFHVQSNNVRFVTTNVDFGDPEKHPEVDIICLDCGEESVGFSVAEEQLSEMRDAIGRAVTPISKDADAFTIIRALYEIVRKNTESRGLRDSEGSR